MEDDIDKLEEVLIDNDLSSDENGVAMRDKAWKRKLEEQGVEKQ